MAPRSPRAANADTVFDRRRVSDARGATTGQPQSLGRRRAGDDQHGTSRRATVERSSSGEEPAPRKRRATRDGREPLVVYMLPDAIKALKIAAVEQDTTASAIVTEAVTMWLNNTARRAAR
jgi:hypothetical protein